MITFAVVDDEKELMDTIYAQIRAIFAKFGTECIGDKYEFGEELVNSGKNYDLLFLDIEMPGMDGITLAEKMREKESRAKVIFVSSREDQVYKSFSVQPFRFVRKMVFRYDLEEAIGAYLEEISSRQSIVVKIKNNTVITKVAVTDIVYIESQKNCQEIHLVGEKEPIVVYTSLDELEKEFPFGNMMRIHKGIIVNFRYVDRIDKEELLLKDGAKLYAARRKVKEVHEAFLHYLTRSEN